jgi:hypothetical protein
MLGAALRRGDEREERRLLGGAIGANDVGDPWFPLGERAGLVEHDRPHGLQSLEGGLGTSVLSTY